MGKQLLVGLVDALDNLLCDSGIPPDGRCSIVGACRSRGLHQVPG